MKLLAHASPLVLEAELLDRVAAAKKSDPLAPVLIVAPSRRLADHVLRRLVERFGAILGVTVLHHRALAERITERSGMKRRPVLDDDLLHTLFSRVVHAAPAGPLRDFVRAHPGAAIALRETLTDLREAGIDPAEARSALSGVEAETSVLYARWSGALDELAQTGSAIDDAGLALDATAHAAAFAAGFQTIIHHGAYDLIGVRVELLRALDRGRELTFLLPADPVESSGSFGIDRARRIAPSGTAIEAFEQDASRVPVSFLHAQGTRAELQAAAYEALAAVGEGVPPHEVAIVVRSFRPYAGAMDALLDAEIPRWHTSYTRPLRSDPKVAASLAAMAAVTGGGVRRFSGHADELEAIARDHGGFDELSRLLQALRGLETLLGDDRSIPRGEAVGWLEARATAATMAVAGADGSGVRILDAMQARGLTFAQIGLVGMNVGIFPRVPRENPFLSDESRARLRKATGCPLPLARESDGEERLLLAMLLGAAGRRAHVSWRRADDEARPLTPSLALRDLARFAAPDAKPEAVLKEARALPAHPRARLAALAHSPGLLRRDEETLLAALASETVEDGGKAVIRLRPELGAGVALVPATEVFDTGPGAYDGRIDVPYARATVATTALESLGRCPLQFFFRQVLRVEAPRTPPTPFETDAASRGSRVHDALCDVYTRLRDEGAFDHDDVEARIARAKELLGEAWAASASPEDAARAAALPVLEGIEARLWLSTLGSFLTEDLRRMTKERRVPESLEQDVRGAIPGLPENVVVRAKFDRVLTGPSGSIVGDYKTGRSVKDRVNRRSMLRGAELQVPVYALLSGFPVELLAVGPRHDTEDGVVSFDGFDSDNERNGIVETIRVVTQLAASGRYPLHSGDHCRFCDYSSACRRGHPPTEDREDRAADARDARACWSKTAKTPLLSTMRKETAP